MSEQEAQPRDEVGQAAGPQAAAKEALGVEIDGHEGDGGGAQDEGASSAQGPSEQTWQQIVPPVLKLGSMLASARWPKMALSEAEVAAMTEVLCPVLEKHCGGAIPIEYLAAGTCAAIVLPKVLETWLDSRKQQAAQEAEHEHGGAGTTTP